jgi:hypothetical protein
VLLTWRSSPRNSTLVQPVSATLLRSGDRGGLLGCGGDHSRWTHRTVARLGVRTVVRLVRRIIASAGPSINGRGRCRCKSKRLRVSIPM